MTVKSCAQSTKSGLATWQNLYEAKLVPAKFAEIGASDFCNLGFYKMYVWCIKNSILFCIQNLYKGFLKGLQSNPPFLTYLCIPFWDHSEGDWLMVEAFRFVWNTKEAFEIHISNFGFFSKFQGFPMSEM